MLDASALLRNEPVQARSTARLASLLDAAAAAIDALGYERLTTAMVAERAGASIGTVYRYFPDRIAVLQAVSARAVDRFTEKVRASVTDTGHDTWWDAFDAVIDDFVSSFREEPAFAALRFGDVIDLRPREGADTGASRVVRELVPVFVSRYGLPEGDLGMRLEVVITIVDALLSRAFSFESSGDDAYIGEARRVAREYLVGHYGEPKQS
ncbi:TetR family transcriptional regulator [Cryobacterium sp. BB307]|uniref:TetR family transcriptional regulator n=1 Tax=Cryobacterium sp. BB307 TaxID=2716317 RepID=UPI00144663ED